MVLRPGILEKVLQDLVAAELQETRRGKPGGAAPRPQELLTAGLDSFELYTAAAATSIMFHVHETGLEDLLLARPRPADWVEIVQQCLLAPEASLSFRSSGSTGARALHPHTVAELQQEVAQFREQLPHPLRIVSTVPSHHIYGFLFTALLPSQLEVPVLDVRGPQALHAALGPGDLLVSFPFALERMLHFGSVFGDGVTVLCSTAPCPPEIASAVRATGAKLFEIYGSSETAGVGVRSRTNAAYSLLPYFRRHNENGLLVRTCPTAPGHQQHSSAGHGRKERVVQLPDKVEWTSSREFRPVGRLDGAVQVGGVNVYPDTVSRLLARHTRVAAAAVRPYKTADGLRLKAFVVPRAASEAEHPELERELRAYVADHVEAAGRPVLYTFGAALPRNQLGKLCDWPV